METIRILAVVAFWVVALVLLGTWLGLEPLAVPILIVAWTAVIAFATGAVKLGAIRG